MVISGKLHAKKHYDQLFFPQKKKFRPTSDNGRFRDFETELETPFGNEQFFFSQNLTYSYSFLGRNLPGITMFSESLNKYFVITVKSRKNNQKFSFVKFWLWRRNNDEMIATSR